MENMEDTNKPSQQSFIEQLAQRIGLTAKASSVYGEPVERDGQLVGQV